MTLKFKKCYSPRQNFPLFQCNLEDGRGTVVGEAGPVKDVVLDVEVHVTYAVCLSVVSEEEARVFSIL